MGSKEVPLADRPCKHLPPGTPALSADAIAALLQQLDGWTVVGDGQELVKEYGFPDFAQALAYVDRLGAAAEKAGHHPDVFLSCGKVRVSFSTHSIGGLSENDFILAAQADRAL